MATECCDLKARGGLKSTGTAETVRYGAAFRWGRSAAIVAVGLVIGLMLTPVPGLHLIAPWLIPLVCAAVAFYLAGVRFRLDRVQGTCPTCGQPCEATDLGLVRNEEIWIQCAACKGPIVVEVAATPREAPAGSALGR